jgi:hypothetical protein
VTATMRVLLWLVEGTWQGCVDAARPLLPADPEVTLLHVAPSEVEEATTGALAGLLGRGRPGPGRHPAAADLLSDQAAAALLNAAEARLGRQARQQVRRGRVERLVVEAAEDADLLVWPDETPAAHTPTAGTRLDTASDLSCQDSLLPERVVGRLCSF